MVTGWRTETEIIDLMNKDFHCSKIEQKFPVKLGNAAGGLVEGVPLVCGSKACFTLKKSGANWVWKEDLSNSLNQVGSYSGSTVFKNSLVVAGGWGPGYLASVEIVKPYVKTILASKGLPVAMYSPCVVPWDADRYLVIGGESWGQKIRKETHFMDMQGNTSPGPNLNIARYYFACHEVVLNNEAFIIVTGGSTNEAFKTTEYLSKSTPYEWIKGRKILNGFLMTYVHKK